MSTKTVIVALVVALALGLAAYILVKSGGHKPVVDSSGVVAVTESVIDLDPATVKSIRVRVPGEPDQIVERVGAPGSGQWRLVIQGEGKGGGSWPVLAERPRSLLRLISAMRAISETEKTASVGPDPLVLELTMGDGGARTIRLASRTLGGSGLIEIDPMPGTPSTFGVRKAMVDDSLHRALKSPGPRGWRDTSVVGGSAMDATRIKLESEGQAVTIARLGGDLKVQEPVSCEADDAAIKRLVRTLDAMQVKDFLDTGAPDEAALGLSKPTARIVLETERREGDGSAVRTSTREISIGNRAETKSEVRYARLEKDGSPVVVTVAGLGRELFDPAQYPSPQAVGTPAADIGTILLESSEVPQGASASAASRRLVRKMSDWTEAGADGQERTLSANEARGVQDFLIFLTKKPAASVALERPGAYAPVGRLTTLSPGGQPQDVLEIGTSGGTGGAGGGTMVLYTRTPGAAERRGVYRSYPVAELPPLLAPFAGTLKPAGAPAADATPDVVK